MRAAGAAAGLWASPLTFVDVETTGASAATGRVIEVGAVRVERGVAVAKFSSLVAPGRPVPASITQLTGITGDDLAGAPQFGDIESELAKMLSGAVFVAHNAAFDYGFLHREFERSGRRLAAPRLCTVIMSRQLFPQYSHHRLADLIERHQLAASRRHRAYDDAHCLWQWYGLCLAEFDLDTLEAVMRRQLGGRLRLDQQFASNV